MPRIKNREGVPRPIRARGIFLVVNHPRTGWTAKAWPKKPKTPPTAAQIRARAEFGAAARATKTASDLDWNAARELTVGTPYYPRDALLSAMYGKLLQWTMSDGTIIIGRRVLYPELQQALDVITNVPGSMLFRNAAVWAQLPPGNDGDVLFYNAGDALPHWAPPPDPTPDIQTLLDSLGMVEGDMLYRSVSGWTVIAAGSAGDVLTSSGVTSPPAWLPNAGPASPPLLIGTGAPTALADAGTLYSRADAIELYQSHPTTSGGALAVVQSGFHTSTFVNPHAVLPGAPTIGNLIVCFYAQNTTATLSADWTQFAINGLGSGHDSMYGVYRYAQSGDGATLPDFNTDSGNIVRVLATELSGVSGVFASDFDSYVTASASPIGPLTTTNPNELLILASTEGGGFGSYTPSTGWTNQLTDGGGSSTLDDVQEPSASTAVTATPSWSIGGTSGKWIMAAFVGGSGSPVAHWDQIYP
jgi:hypothetical protein